MKKNNLNFIPSLKLPSVEYQILGKYNNAYIILYLFIFKSFIWYFSLIKTLKSDLKEK